MTVIRTLKAEDNTGKIIIELDDKTLIESVLLEDQSNRITACLSSQVGCAQGCKFCKTAQMGLKRNLTSTEIIEQFNLLKKSFNRTITNIVYMGMGEPLHNTTAVLESIRYFTNPKTENIFLRRITVSTSGVTKGIKELVKQQPYPGLAFSLISADSNIREKIMPNTPSLTEIKNELIYYQKKSNKRIIIEVIVFKNINNTKEEATAIAEYLKGLDVIVNLIPYNTTGADVFKSPSLKQVELFSKYVKESGLRVTIRHSKGTEIAGACGQLGE